MRDNKILVMLLLLAIPVLILAGYAAFRPKPEPIPEAAIAITGLPSGDLTATAKDIRALKPCGGKVEGADSSGDAVVYDVKGGCLSDLLEKNGCNQADLTGIRVIATDGYSIEVSKEILAARDVVIAYEMDGKPLDEKNAPFRVFIPGERAMYWVRMVSEINVLPAADPGVVSGVYIVSSLYSGADYQDLELAGSKYRVLDAKMVLEDHPGGKGDTVIMVASDGLTKNETLENFCKGAIRMEGEGSPEFLSSALPRGMFVKNLALFKYGGNAFFFAPSEATSLDAVAKSSSLAEAEKCTLRFADGTSHVVEPKDLSSWALGIEGGKAFVQKQGDPSTLWNLTEITNN